MMNGIAVKFALNWLEKQAIPFAYKAGQEARSRLDGYSERLDERITSLINEAVDEFQRGLNGLESSEDSK